MTLPDRPGSIRPGHASRNSRIPVGAVSGCLGTSRNDAADIFARGRGDYIIGSGDMWGSRPWGGESVVGSSRGGDEGSCRQGANDR